MEQAAGSVVVQIGGNIAPFEAALAKARQLAESFDAKVSAQLSGSASAGMAKIATAVGQTNAMLEKLVASSADSNAALAKLNATALATNEALAKLGSQSARAVSESMANVNRSTSSGVIVMDRLSKAVNDNSKAFQVNRIGMMELRAAGINTFQALAAGMAPFQVAMMEGAQVVGAFVQGTEGGLKGLLGALGTRASAAGLATLAAMATPIGTVTTAVLGASTAVLAYGVATRKTIVPLNDLIKQQADEIKSLGTAYGDAAKAAKNYAATAAGFGLASTATIDQLRISMADSVQRMGPSIGRLINPGKSAGGFFQASSEFAPFADAIKYLQKTARDGEPDILGFRQMVEQKWALSPNSKSLTEAAAKLEQMTADAAKAAEALRNLKAVQDQIISNKNAGPGGLGLNLDADAGSASRDKFLSDQSARIAQMRRDLDAELQSINARTVAQRAEAASAAILAGRGGTKEERQFQANAAAQKVFAQATMDAKNALIQSQDAMKTAGLTGYARGLAEINAQIAEQIRLNPENAATWRKVGEAQKAALQANTIGPINDNIAFTRAQMFRTSSDQQIAAALRGTGLGFDSPQAQAMRQNMQIAQIRGTFDTFFSTFQSEAGRQGTSIGKAVMDGFRQAALSVANNLAKQFFDQISGWATKSIAGLFGIGGSGATSVPSVGGGSIVGSLLGSAGSVVRAALPSVGSMSAYADAIKSIESSGNYSALGPILKSGDRAYGAYQVMGSNIPSWTKAALGRSLTPQQFLADPSAQDAVFDSRFGGYLSRFGNPQDAASAWFTGRPLSMGAGASDVFGATGASYVAKFNEQLSDATKNLNVFGGGLGKIGQTLSGAFPAAPAASGGGGGLFGWLGGLFGGGSAAPTFTSTASELAYWGFANGTTGAPPGWAWVGERGPELMRFRGGEQVIPSHVSKSIVRGYADGTPGFVRALAPANINSPMASPRGLHITWAMDADSEGNLTPYIKNVVEKEAPGIADRHVAAGLDNFNKAQKRGGVNQNSTFYQKMKA